MGVIMHNNIPYGGGSTIEPNPQESATDQLETLGIDGDVYDVTDANAIHTSDVGVANGVAELDANGKVPSSQLPSYVDDVLEYASRSAFPATGETGKIYVALDTNLTYRWSGSAYVEISQSLALGTTHQTAAYGDDAVSTAEPTYSEAITRTNLAGSGEKLSVIFGKIKKWFSDLKDLAFTAIDGANSKKYLRGDGTWQNFPTIPTVNDATLTIQKNGTAVETFTANSSTNKTANITVPTKVSDLTDDVVNGHYLPLTGGTLTGNLNVSNNGVSDTALYVRGNSTGAYIGFHNANGGTTYGYYGVKNDNKPYFYSGTSKRIVLDDELPTKLSDLTNDLNKIKDIGNSADTTFAYSKTGLGYNDYTWLAGWNGYELRAVGKTQFAQNYVEGRLSNSDSYTALAHGYYGGNAGSIWRIKFPDAMAHAWTMINMTVSLRQTWNPAKGGKVMIHGYHNSTSPWTWTSLKAEVYGSLTNDIKVYGSDGQYIYIAGLSGGYTNLLIDDLMIGDSARSTDFRDTVVDMVSELPTTYQTATMKYAFYNTGGLLADGATNTPLSIQSYNSTEAWISFRDSNGNIMGYYGVHNNKPVFWDTAEREVITSATIGSQSVDKATKDGDGNTISSTYAKKTDIATFEADGSAGTGTGYRRIALINITTPGKYLVTAWMSTNGSGRKGIAISNSSNSNYRASWNSDNVDTSYPITMTCIDVVTVSSTLYLQARAYNTNSSTTGEPGGIYAVKIS